MPELDNPWQGLARSESGHFNAKRADETHPHNFYWACNSSGGYTFLLSLTEDPGDWRSSAQIRGMELRLYREQRQLQIVLSDNSEWQLFAVLCRDLMDACRQALDTREVMDALVARIERWQRLLSRGPKRILDKHEIRGLLGELLFLRNELLPRFGAPAALHWQGPAGKPQDFVVGPTLVEVKTVRPGDSPKVFISSPDQMWSDGLPLFLFVISLADCGPNAPGAITLPAVVEDISARLAGTAALDSFETNLAAAGYIPYPEYSDHIFLHNGNSCYSVADGFPIVPRENLPEGVGDISYSIRLASCEAFRAVIDWESVVGSAG